MIALSLCSHFLRVNLHRRHDPEIALYTLVVVIEDIILNHPDQFFSGMEGVSVVPFTFHDPPETFHRSVVDTVSDSGHALCHSMINEFLVENAIRILKSSVTVKYRSCIRIVFYCDIKGIEYEFVVIGVSYHIRHDPSVT